MIGRCKICVWPGFQSLSIVIGLCRKKIYNYIIRNLTKAAETLNKYKGPNFARCLQLISKLLCQCAARMVQTMFAIINWNNHFVDILPAKFCCFKGGGVHPWIFWKQYSELCVGGDDQDMSQHFWGGFLVHAPIVAHVRHWSKKYPKHKP